MGTVFTQMLTKIGSVCFFLILISANLPILVNFPASEAPVTNI